MVRFRKKELNKIEEKREKKNKLKEEALQGILAYNRGELTDSELKEHILENKYFAEAFSEILNLKQEIGEGIDVN